jgi:hypothetical protein
MQDQFGARLAEHKWRGFPAASAIIAILFIGVPAAVTLLAATGRLPMGENWSIGSYFGAAVMYAMPIFGVYFLVDQRRRRGDSAVIYERGVALRKKGELRLAAFDDVVALKSLVKQEVRNGIPGPIMHTHTLVMPAGKELVFTHGFTDIVGLLALLRVKTLAVLLPRCRAALRDGRRVDFGPIIVERGGVTKGTTVHWAELDDATVSEGLLTVRRRGARWMSVAAADVDNIHVLIELVQDPPK